MTPRGGVQSSRPTSTSFGASTRTSSRGIDADEITAPAAVDVDPREIEHAPFHVDRHLLPRRERRGAADLVAGVTLRDFGCARFDALHADLAREVLGRDGTVAVHQHDERAFRFVLHDQRLDDRELVESQRLGARARAAVLDVLEHVLGVGDAMRLEECRRRRFGDARALRHGRQPRGWCFACSALSRSRATWV